MTRRPLIGGSLIAEQASEASLFLGCEERSGHGLILHHGIEELWPIDRHHTCLATRSGRRSLKSS